MTSSVNNICIYHHLGLGDHIICNGLVRHYAEYMDVVLLCKENNIENISHMYKDIKNIKLVSVQDDIEANIICNNTHNHIRTGIAIGGRSYRDVLWDESFYKNLGISFDFSWSKFKCYRDLSTEELLFETLVGDNEDNYSFVHCRGSAGVDMIDWSKLDTTRIISADPKIPFFSYGKIIENASSIHCVNSSYIHLIDRMNISNNIKLFYHKNFKTRSYSDFTLKKKWSVI